MNRFATYFFFALAFALLAPVATTQAQTIVYVDESASGANDGTSWQDAYTNLQDAFDEANAGSGGYAIHAAEGVYYPDEDMDGDHTGDAPGEAFAFLRDGIVLRGGYPSGGGMRDPSANPTVLSGDITQNDGDPDGDGVIEQGDAQEGENSFHVISFDGRVELLTTATGINGIVVTAGQADGGFPDNTGGGALCRGNGSGSSCGVLIANAVFSGNAGTAGAGLTNLGTDGGQAPSTTINTLFTGNVGAGNGGAVRNDNADPALINLTFSDNSANNGGAVFNSSSSPTITNSILYGDSVSGGGSEIFNFHPEAQPTVSYSIVQGGESAIASADDGTVNYEDTNMDVNPQFAAPGEGDYRVQGPGSGGGASAAIDAGDNTAVPDTLTNDLGGMERFFDVTEVSDTGNGSPPIVDMGAYESDSSPLPVELAAFNVQADGRAALLSWETASETTNDGFLIERKSGVEGWKRMDFVDSQTNGGTSQEPLRYQFRTGELDYGQHVFRLVQRDLDGKETPVGKQTVEVKPSASYDLSAAYPNPFSTRMTMEFTVREAQRVRVELYNALGQRVRVLWTGQAKAAQRQPVTVRASALSSGVYFVRLKGKNFTASRKVTLVR